MAAGGPGKTAPRGPAPAPPSRAPLRAALRVLGPEVSRSERPHEPLRPGDHPQAGEPLDRCT